MYIEDKLALFTKHPVEDKQSSCFTIACRACPEGGTSRLEVSHLFGEQESLGWTKTSSMRDAIAQFATMGAVLDPLSSKASVKFDGNPFIVAADSPTICGFSESFYITRL